MPRELRERDASRPAGDRLAPGRSRPLAHHADADLAAAMIASTGPSLARSVGSPERRTAQMEGQVRVAPGVNTPTRPLVDRDAAAGGPGEHHDYQEDGGDGGDSDDDDESNNASGMGMPRSSPARRGRVQSGPE